MSTARKINTALTILAEVQQELLAREQPIHDSSEALISADDVAARLGLKNGHSVRYWPAKGCPHVRAGRLLRFRMSEVTEWLNAGRPSAMDQLRAHDRRTIAEQAKLLDEKILELAIMHHVARGRFQPSPACSEVKGNRVVLRNTVGDKATYTHVFDFDVDDIHFELVEEHPQK